MAQHTLLFVDDEVDILNILQRIFRNEGYNVITASSGAEGLEKLKGNKISLVMSDQRMPGMTGVEFLSRVREISPDTIRVVLTGYADIDIAISAINQGEVYRFISKPWNDEELRLTVRQALERYDLEMENRRLSELTKKRRSNSRPGTYTSKKRWMREPVR
ncbi:MAG: response regulator [bacterium]